VDELDWELQNLLDRHYINTLPKQLWKRIACIESHFEADPKHLLWAETEELSTQLDQLLQLTTRSISNDDLQLAYEDLQGRYLKLQSHVAKRISPISPKPGTSDYSGSRSHTPTSLSPKYKLPKISLPEFEGDLLNWEFFWERFSTAVHDNTLLSYSDSLTYLRAALKDEAAAKLAPSNVGIKDNCETIVALLKDRYDRLKLVHRMCFKTLSHHKMKANTREELYELQAVLEKVVTSLQRSKMFNAESIITSMEINTMEYNLLQK